MEKNELVVAKGPELNFVLDMHTNDFIEETKLQYEIVNIYGIPAVQDIPYDPVIFYAASIYGLTGDIKTVEDELSGYTEKDLREKVDNELEEMEYEIGRIMHEFRSDMVEDMMAVLNHHHMCYFLREYNPFTGKSFLWINNEPITEVW